MKIYIPSHKRAFQQTTFHQLPPEIQKITQIAVYEDEQVQYASFPTILVPNEPRGIWHKRQWLLDNCPENYMVMIDDDLVFATRRSDDPTKFTPSDATEVKEMFWGIRDMLRDEVVHGAVATREGGNRDTNEFKENTRALRFHFYFVPTLRKERVRFDRTTFMQDFDMTLQLLRKGYPNLILNHWVHNQHGSNTHGGCSTSRTAEKHAEAAYKLKELHPDYVTVVKKTTKGAWGGGERTDVRIQWKRAYQDSQRTA